MRMKERMHRRLKRSILTIALILSLSLMPMAQVLAAPDTVTPFSAVLFTGSGAEVFSRPEISSLVKSLPGDLPIQVTGVTENGFIQVALDGQTYYIYGKALSPIPGTRAHKLTSIDAKAALVADAATGNIIYQYNADGRRAPASTTKILTTLLVLEAVERGQIGLDTPLIVSPVALSSVPDDASHVKPALQAGEVMNVLQLLQCVMMVSDCHACNVLAEAVAGSVDNFVALMNVRAAQLGCVDTNFTNPSGYPDENMYTNAYSLFRIKQEAMKHPAYQALISTQTAAIPQTNLTPERILNSTNALIMPTEYYNPYVIGSKTGTASSSGACLVTSAKKENKTVITVILGASTGLMSDGATLKQQFSETNKLVSMGLQ